MNDNTPKHSREAWWLDSDSLAADPPPVHSTGLVVGKRRRPVVLSMSGRVAYDLTGGEIR